MKRQYTVHTIAIKILLKALKYEREKIPKIRPDSETETATKIFDSETAFGTQNLDSGSDSGSRPLGIRFRFRFRFL